MATSKELFLGVRRWANFNVIGSSRRLFAQQPLLRPRQRFDFLDVQGQSTLQAKCSPFDPFASFAGWRDGSSAFIPVLDARTAADGHHLYLRVDDRAGAALS
jgi:hypothetical protein